MKRTPVLLAAGLPLIAAAVFLPTASAETVAAGSAPLNCSAVSVKPPAGTEVEHVTAVRQAGGTVEVESGPLAGSVTDVPAYCEVTLTLTHPGAGDHAKVRVWLPATGWNGRFQALGGSAYAAGDNGLGLAGAVKQGYAAATTDAGVGDLLDTTWALDGKGRINTPLLKNFAERSQHDAAVVAKQVVAEVYGRAASYAYFNGCSTGGREGYMEAQRHPDDFDGILAGAPAINWDEFEVATLWPQVVMNEERAYPTSCEFKAVNEAVLKACDTLDGAKDGLVADVSRCAYDPRELIGTKTVCDGEEGVFTAADAAVVRKIWDGPRTTAGGRLWYGLPVGADFEPLAASAPDDGNVKGTPFSVPAAWVATFVKKQPSFDTSTLTSGQFTRLFRQSQAEFGSVIGSDDPDLSGFRDSGGKLLTWHGQADQLIPTQGTVDYRERVERQMGGSHRVDDFYRLFLAPGTAHCGLSGRTDDLGALRAWVEQGRAPGTLTAALTDASGGTVTRELCRYPLVSRYAGDGAPATAEAFDCVRAARSEPRGSAF
ncbi:tannase/feruloyl esterase family alpha/beta hydrolase [Streptomyces sp. ITFR-16]|uniref:tannase/feruloyl esterase family alpha/beta hydrolase n=1 Tax=Streptomyces sp. ITFR-16 TaxID=3075198 RepID=UPI002889BEDE|nr:tannase/feruloyl esterase family alpha/beta hydrolase [Streptomyces sp. ITFR-16]WNI26649.1 tannase/feruloyl esterase family alpha/beta hydrolase [Streptomyces sp. ITFR-16]